MATTGRLQAIDVYRGIALIAMAAYHICWDLAHYGLIDVGVGVDPVWITIQRSILTAFLLLAGASLTLAHGTSIRWRSFWRREAVLVGAALLVSAGTWFLFQWSFAWFGVLHLIALGSILALPFIGAAAWMVAAGAAVFLFAPLVWNGDLFDPKWLDWIGFFRVTPDTADLVPVFPWFGVMLLGLLGIRYLRATPALTWASAAPPARVLAFLGRLSLLFYLLHQPILFGIIAPIAGWVNNAEQAKLTGFVQSCEAKCGVNSDAPFCAAYCQCALDVTVRDNLWNAPSAELLPMTRLCTEMAK